MDTLARIRILILLGDPTWTHWQISYSETWLKFHQELTFHPTAFATSMKRCPPALTVTTAGHSPQDWPDSWRLSSRVPKQESNHDIPCLLSPKVFVIQIGRKVFVTNFSGFGPAPSQFPVTRIIHETCVVTCLWLCLWKNEERREVQSREKMNLRDRLIKFRV